MELLDRRMGKPVREGSPSIRGGLCVCARCGRLSVLSSNYARKASRRYRSSRQGMAVGCKHIDFFDSDYRDRYSVSRRQKRGSARTTRFRASTRTSSRGASAKGNGRRRFERGGSVHAGNARQDTILGASDGRLYGERRKHHWPSHVGAIARRIESRLCECADTSRGDSSRIKRLFNLSRQKRSATPHRATRRFFF